MAEEIGTMKLVRHFKESNKRHFTHDLFICLRFNEPDWQQTLKYIGDIHNTITDRN